MSVSVNLDHSLEDIDHTQTLAMDEDRLHHIKHHAASDPVFLMLQQTICQGSPESPSELPEALHVYHGFQDELIVQDQLIFKGHCLLIPMSMRKEMIHLVHKSHIGTEGCIRQARECFGKG